MSAMTWFLAVLIVLVMGAVAVVAAGRGGAMAEVYDRPDSVVQADGPLTAGDLRRVRFSTAFRGYRMAEVDALLDRLADELESRDHVAAAPAGDPPHAATDDAAGATDQPADSTDHTTGGR
jgi:DivIVA domain-containing protein